MPVIGVGNLSFGGSGKTLLTECVADKLALSGKRVGIVCRSYGAEPGPRVLPAAGHGRPSAERDMDVNRSAGDADPYVVGDEAAMLRASFVQNQKIQVAAGRDKTSAAKMLLERAPDLDVIVVDDAYQHHRLKQDLKILIWPHPGARLREFRSAASVADVLLVPNGLPSPRPDSDTVYFVKEIKGIEGQSGLTPAKDGQVQNATGMSSVLPPDHPENFCVVAGLGPETDFFHQVRKLFSVDQRRKTNDGPDSHERRVTAELRLPDHADYRGRDIQARLQQASAACDAVLTTAKDAVKLQYLAPELPPIYVVQVGIRFLTNEDLFWRKIETAVKKGA